MSLRIRTHTNTHVYSIQQLNIRERAYYHTRSGNKHVFEKRFARTVEYNFKHHILARIEDKKKKHEYND